MKRNVIYTLACLMAVLLLIGCNSPQSQQVQHRVPLEGPVYDQGVQPAEAYKEGGATAVIPIVAASQSTIPPPIRLTPVLPAINNDAPTYEDIRREMLELWQNQGTPNPELFVKTAEYQQLNDKFRGAKAKGWKGWVISAVTPGLDIGYQGEPGIVKVSMSGPKPNNGEAADVILNQVALEQMQKLDAYHQSDENISPQQIVLTGTITVVLFYGGVALENVEIEPTQ